VALAALSGRGNLDEQAAFATAMTLIGPYVSVGRPGEGSKYGGVDIGAAKMYVEDNDWQDVVRNWLLTASAVVIEVGPSQGVLWELDYAIRHVESIRLLLVLPSDDDDYRDFRDLTETLFVKPLPMQRPVSRLLTFDSALNPLTFSPDGQLQSTLRPFFERLGLIVPEIIELSEGLRTKIKERVRDEKFFGASEYIESLINADHLRNSRGTADQQ
jgi:hypothetical protein